MQVCHVACYFFVSPLLLSFSVALCVIFDLPVLQVMHYKIRTFQKQEHIARSNAFQRAVRAHPQCILRQTH